MHSVFSQATNGDKSMRQNSPIYLIFSQHPNECKQVFIDPNYCI